MFKVDIKLKINCWTEICRNQQSLFHSLVDKIGFENNDIFSLCSVKIKLQKHMLDFLKNERSVKLLMIFDSEYQIEYLFMVYRYS